MRNCCAHCCAFIVTECGSHSRADCQAYACSVFVADACSHPCSHAFSYAFAVSCAHAVAESCTHSCSHTCSHCRTYRRFLR